MIDVTQSEMELIKYILRKFVPEAELYIFGSRVNGESRKHSDLDLVIKNKLKIDFSQMTKIKEAFENSKLPYRVDVLDWFRLDDDFKKIIFEDYEKIEI
ncbi:MAG: nucleotidyltransferase domain-containing protein [Pseudomonadota bacterium]